MKSPTICISALVATLLAPFATAVPENEADLEKADARQSRSGAERTTESVVIPAGTQNMVEILSRAEDFTTLVAAIEAAGLTETLKGDGPLTIFAPTNAAFNALPAGTLPELMKEGNELALVTILTYHVVPGRHMAMDLAPGDLPTTHGNNLRVTARTVMVDQVAPPEVPTGASPPVQRQNVLIEGADLLRTDIAASNGVIHVVDRVLLPVAEVPVAPVPVVPVGEVEVKVEVEQVEQMPE